MPQHDMIIDNGSGAGVRADLNNALAALASAQKGPNAPPAPIAGMFWLDDDTPSTSVWTLKFYDGADWITVGFFDISANTFALPLPARLLTSGLGSASAPAFSFDADPNTGIFSTGPDQLALSVGGDRLVDFSSQTAVLNSKAGASEVFLWGRTIDASALNSRAYQCGALNEISTPVSSFRHLVNADGSGNIEIYATPPGARNVDRRALRMLIPGSGPATIDGKALQIQRGTELPTTSAPVIDLTGIPAGVRRLTLFLSNVSTNGASLLAIRLGTSGGFLSAGYNGLYGIWGAGGSAYGVNSSGILLHNGAAVDSQTGVLVLENPFGNIWHARFNGFFSDGSGPVRLSYSSGILDLGGVLSQVRLTTVAGTPVFDAGGMTPMWEF